MSNEIMNEVERVYRICNDFLKYHEAKNATLIAANIAVLSIFSKYISGDCFFMLILSMISVLFIVLGIAISAASFFPNASHYDSNEYKANTYFFMDCAIMHSNDLLERVRNTEQLPKELAEEAIIIAQIAKHKMKVFKLALISSIISYVFFILLLVVDLF